MGDHRFLRLTIGNRILMAGGLMMRRRRRKMKSVIVMMIDNYRVL